VSDPVDIAQLKNLVAAERTKRGLSLRAAAEQAEVPFNTLARVEKGHLPDLANFRRIVEWIGLPPEQFFQPAQARDANTLEAIADRLAQDPNLSEAAAAKIAALVRELYSNLAINDRTVKVHLRAARTFTPRAASMLVALLTQMQRKLTTANEVHE
jgi:transcriptional regulator with XRE-family HTH domain